MKEDFAGVDEFCGDLSRLDVHVMEVSILTDDDIRVFYSLPSCLFFFLGVLRAVALVRAARKRKMRLTASL